MKISVIGGGGVRSLFLAKSLAQKADELGISSLAFMDNDETKLNIYGRLARQTALRICPELDFVLTADAKEAVTDADYVITTIREGGDEMRVRDESIALSLGVLGQETTGAAGFSFAIRSVQALADYCELVKRYAKPSCKVFNFTNPAGVVSQTLRDMGYDFTYGICDAPSGMLRSFEKLYGAPEGSMKGEVYGLNHLSYFASITLDGREVMPEIIENDEAYEKTDMRYFEKQLLKERGAVLNEYLYSFYYREQALANILKAEKTRGEQILELPVRPELVIADGEPVFLDLIPVRVVYPDHERELRELRRIRLARVFAQIVAHEGEPRLRPVYETGELRLVLEALQAQHVEIYVELEAVAVDLQHARVFYLVRERKRRVVGSSRHADGLRLGVVFDRRLGGRFWRRLGRRLGGRLGRGRLFDGGGLRGGAASGQNAQQHTGGRQYRDHSFQENAPFALLR